MCIEWAKVAQKWDFFWTIIQYSTIIVFKYFQKKY